MKQMEEELAALKQTQEADGSVQDGAKKKTEWATLFLEENELTEDMKEKLIEKVIVYSGNRIEIVWKFGEHPYRLQNGSRSDYDIHGIGRTNRGYERKSD